MIKDLFGLAFPLLPRKAAAAGLIFTEKREGGSGEVAGCPVL